MKINRTMLERRIQKNVVPTWENFQACTGEEALKMCQLEEFDVIIMD
jgi:CheY-like chemotaxis protein